MLDNINRNNNVKSRLVDTFRRIKNITLDEGQVVFAEMFFCPLEIGMKI